MRWRQASFVVFAVALAGCQRDFVDYDDYLSRLERTLNLERTTQVSSQPLRPQRHQLLPAPSNRYGLFDTYSLKPCGVLNLVAEHNNQLGRVATPSQQLIYHYKVTHLLNSCDVNTLTATGKKLHQQVLSDKLSRLPSYGARLMLLTDAIWNNLDASANAGVLSNNELQQTLLGLAKLRNDLTNPSALVADPSSQLESMLKTVHQLRQPRQLNRAMIDAVNGLNQATELIERAEQDSCNKQRFTILNNILHQIYAKRIQPQLGLVYRQVNAITPPLQQLLSPWPDSDYFQYYLSEEKHSLRAQFSGAIDRHTAAWQRLFSMCNETVEGRNYAMNQR